MPIRKIIYMMFFSSIFLLYQAHASHAKRIDNKYALLTLLNKITAELMIITAPIDKIVEYGSLKIRVYKCYSRSIEENQKITALMEIYDAGPLREKYKRIFAGWQFAGKPSLNAFEHLFMTSG